ncbi:hypothetical protein FRB96_008158 [Tulasnella sp. 330]|nr:hypothetical protein FRB96_008158 [Tulasnella sp. 330]
MDKFAAGPHYGPVLTTTDLYLLRCELALHPILTHSFGAFHLILNLASGHAGGYNPANKDQDLELVHGNEPATIPRVQELHIISRLTPWHTHVRNPTGVTLGDVCAALGKQYAEAFITEAELDTLPARTRDQIKRAATNAQQIYGGGGGAWGGQGSLYLLDCVVDPQESKPRFFSSVNIQYVLRLSVAWWERQPPPTFGMASRSHEADLPCPPSFFDGLEKDDDTAVKQIGFQASNVFCMMVTS